MKILIIMFPKFYVNYKIININEIINISFSITKFINLCIYLFCGYY